MTRYAPLLAVAVVFLTTDLRAASAKRPNILLVYTDDQSYKTVGCYQEAWPWVTTPNIDRLAEAGVRFRGAYLGAWCMPSRASLLTGQHPHSILSMRMEGPYPGSVYDPQQCPFWPAMFRANGYQTAQIGKWHTGVDAGFGRDWDYQIVWNRPKYPDNAGAYYDKQRLDINGKEQWAAGYPTDNYTKWACEYIRGEHRDAAKPWFLWLCYGSVHGPSKPAPRHRGRYRSEKISSPADIVGPRAGKPSYLDDTQAWHQDKGGRILAGSSGEKVGDEAGARHTTYEDWVRQVNECVPAIDEGVGQVVAALRESHQLENTLIVFTADQGFAMGEHGLRTKLAPYDASYRSPLIISFPGVAARGKTCPQSVNAADLVATLFATADIPLPKRIPGHDLTPLLKDPAAAWNHPCFYEYTGHDFGDDVTKILRDRPDDAIYQKVPWYVAVIQGQWKYVHYLRPGIADEFYDLQSDPEELTNLAPSSAHQAQQEKLRAALIQELKRSGAPRTMWPEE
jgi:arylsulfatase A-like enzyme